MMRSATSFSRLIVWLAIVSSAILMSCRHVPTPAPHAHYALEEERRLIDAGQLQRIASVNQLPQEIAALASLNAGGIADPGKPYNNAGAPRSQLEYALCSRMNCVVRFFEGDGKGGRASGHELSYLRSVEGEKQYFPPLVSAPKREDLNDFEREWFGNDLNSLHEPSLWLASQYKGAEVYRFIYLPTFDPPTSVRLEMVGDGRWVISGVEGSGAAGFRVGAISKTMQGSASASEAEAFRRRVDELGLWSYPTNEAALGDDGSQWILEMVKDGRYHIINRWSPDPGDKLAALELHLLHDIAKWKISERRTY